MNSKDLAIGVLSTTATVLFVGLIVIHTRPQPAFASGMGDTGGDYKVLTGEMFDQEEYLYVIDTATAALAVYRYNMTTGQIEYKDGGALARFFEQGQAAPPAKPAGRGKP
ncbi:MAG: hypothetical protein HOP29_06520 [Phycisphaerales bacterium]|nr:hypothetical protein [Phycisphaerales bacterium]